MSKFQEVMCKFNLNNKEDAKKWILVNHPDKKDHPDHDPNITREIYSEYMPIIKECIKDLLLLLGFYFLLKRLPEQAWAGFCENRNLWKNTYFGLITNSFFKVF